MMEDIARFGTGNSKDKFQQLLPADGWFFRHLAQDESGDAVLYRLAAWALTGDGTVIGLVAPNAPNQQTQRLMGVPPGLGEYLHFDELTDSELRELKKRNAAAKHAFY